MAGKGRQPGTRRSLTALLRMPLSLMAASEPRQGGSEAQLRVGRVLDMLHPEPGDKALLIGETEGLLARRLAGMVDVTWLEPSSEGASRPEAPALRINGYARLRSDPYNLSFPDAGFDAVAAQFTLDQLGDPRRALVEWLRVLRPGGRLALVARNRLYRGIDYRPGPRQAHNYSPRELMGLVEEAGFRVTWLSTLIPDLKLPAFYRGDHTFSLAFERLPYFNTRGKLLFVRAEKERVV